MRAWSRRLLTGVGRGLALLVGSLAGVAVDGLRRDRLLVVFRCSQAAVVVEGDTTGLHLGDEKHFIVQFAIQLSH